MLFFIMMLVTANPYPNLEKKIKTLAPEMKVVPKWIPDTLRLYKDKILPGVPMNLVLAMIQKESSFIHRPYSVGSYGEWGLLQVIPWEEHIKNAAKRYKCHKSEIGKWHRYKKWNNGFYNPPWNGLRAQDPVTNNWFRIKPASPRTKVNGRWFVFENNASMKRFKNQGPSYSIAWYTPCRCVPKTKDCKYSNVGYWNNGVYTPTMTQTTLFLRFSPRGALVTGMYEMKYWQRKYDRQYKKKFWTNAPIWYFKKRGYNVQRSIKWWNQVKSDLGDNVWVVHHNYGGRLVLSQGARWYPYMVAKFYKQLADVGGSSQSTVHAKNMP